MSKLSPEIVENVKRHLAHGWEARYISQKLHISIYSIWNIKHGKKGEIGEWEHDTKLIDELRIYRLDHLKQRGMR